MLKDLWEPHRFGYKDFFETNQAYINIDCRGIKIVANNLITSACMDKIKI